MCAYTGLIGATGGCYEGRFPDEAETANIVQVKAGQKYWVSVQNNDSERTPWYWEMSSTLQGAQGDWVDRHNEYATGCTTFDNDEYSQQCFFPYFQYPDFMLELH